MVPFCKVHRRNRNRAAYKRIRVFAGLFVLIGFRDKGIGTDTITYVYQFLTKSTEIVGFKDFFVNVFRELDFVGLPVKN